MSKWAGRASVALVGLVCSEPVCAPLCRSCARHGGTEALFYIPTAPSARTLRIPPCFCILPSTINKKQLRRTL